MFELTINDAVYEFHFGMGFLREINKRVEVPIDGLHGVKKSIGLQYAVAGVIDGDIEALVDVLELANKGMKPRLTRATLDAFLEDEETDTDELFEKVLGFLKSSNATKKVTNNLLGATGKNKSE